jgi:rhodanese-related sulfurtransferase
MKMNWKRSFLLMLLSVACLATPLHRAAPARTVAAAGAQNPSTTEFISAEQLKTKLARNEPVTIIDVRDTQSYLNSNKIKGSMYVKLRRLAYRLTMPPLKSTPRDREVVTYCACPHDEASIRAAQIFLDAGFKRVHVLQGGWQMWLKVNGQTEQRPKA